MKAFMDDPKERGLITGWRLTQQKMGLIPEVLREFHIMIETDGMAQLDHLSEMASIPRAAMARPAASAVTGAAYFGLASGRHPPL